MGLFDWFFGKIARAVFKKVDRNKNGTIEEIEVEVAVLYLYNVINKRLPGWQDPPAREQIQEALKAFDTDHNGVLDQDEFVKFAKSLCKNGPDTFFSRVGRNALVTTAILPAVATAARSAANATGMESINKLPMVVFAPLLGNVLGAFRAFLPF